MAQITFTIPDNKVQKIIDTMIWLFPIPKDQNGQPLFTNAQWAKEAMRRWVIEQVARKDNYDAKQAVNIQADDTLMT